MYLHELNLAENSIETLGKCLQIKFLLFAKINLFVYKFNFYYLNFIAIILFVYRVHTSVYHTIYFYLCSLVHRHHGLVSFVYLFV